MMMPQKYLEGYENRKLLHYNDIKNEESKLISFKELENTYSDGLLKYLGYVDGELKMLYTDKPHHAAVIAGTRMGKTTSIIMGNILTAIRQRIKKSMLITDPKGEVYSLTKEKLEKEGYRVILYNLRDPAHTSYWNPLTDIFRKYTDMQKKLEDAIDIEDEYGNTYVFDGKVYENREDYEDVKEVYESDQMKYIDDAINEFVCSIIQVKGKDPFWDLSAQEVVKAILWAMLEDSNEKTKNDNCEVDFPLVTEETFSPDTMLKIFSCLYGTKDGLEDYGYFKKRSRDSKARQLAVPTIINQADTTRQCILSSVNAGITDFNSTNVRAFTSHNSIEISEIVEKPTALFITYKDETASSYEVISMIIQYIYKELVDIATKKQGSLDTPFYFFLDEFGNFPKIENFEKEISASAGRNIFFVLAIQSYAQLNRVYGNDVAEIILDNLNLKYFLGSNHTETIRNFSDSCGQYTRISPVSALNGNNAQIEHYTIETVSLVPKSVLCSIEPGETIITEANAKYVMWSMINRYYMCPELNDINKASISEYQDANPTTRKHVYKFKKKPHKKSSFFDDWDW